MKGVRDDAGVRTGRYLLKDCSKFVAAHGRLAKEDPEGEIIRLTSFILRQPKKFGDVFVDIGAECDEQGREYPVENLE